MYFPMKVYFPMNRTLPLAVAGAFAVVWPAAVSYSAPTGSLSSAATTDTIAAIKVQDRGGSVVRERGRGRGDASWHGRDRRHGGGDRPWRRGHYYGWGSGFYLFNRYYYGDCEWLRRRAEDTGSRYWWRRYRMCRWS